MFVILLVLTFYVSFFRLKVLSGLATIFYRPWTLFGIVKKIQNFYAHLRIAQNAENFNGCSNSFF